MDRHVQEKSLKKLRKLLGAAPERRFFEMCWAIDALRLGRLTDAANYLRFPREAIGAKTASSYSVFPWELETLICERLLLGKHVLPPGPSRVFDCGSFHAARSLVGVLRALDEAETALYLKRINILTEMHRIAQRQFAWQAGYFNQIQYYRYAFIYGGPKCAAAFEARTGVSIDTFAFVGFALQSYFAHRPVIEGPIDLQFAEISPASVDNAMRLLSADFAALRAQHRANITDVVKRWGHIPPLAYRPSILRQRPVILLGPSTSLCPLPELLALRTTAGLYYDLVDDSSENRNEASDRFEEYTASLSEHLLPGWSVTRESEYSWNGRQWRTPDVLCGPPEGTDAVIVECKAAKLTYDAQFTENPEEGARRGLLELSKGVFQLWRFMAHVRSGALPAHAGKRMRLLVVTLESWLLMAMELREAVLAGAKALSAADSNILPQDMRHVSFVSIQDYERTLMGGDGTMFLETIDQSTSGEFAGWLLPRVQVELAKRNGWQIAKEYPFSPTDVLPFFGKIAELERAQRG